MQYMDVYNSWLNGAHFDADTKRELLALKGNDKEIEDRFYKSLSFGTGGLRGVIGAGTNRMNVYTVSMATQGLANYILKQGGDAAKKGVAIAHDSRYMSPEFALRAALVLNGNGIKTYLFDSLRPTPVLSFAVRHLGCAAGIVITASHNPKEYNGYKAYWSDGAQVKYPRDEEIIDEVNAITDLALIKTADLEHAKIDGLHIVCMKSVDDAYTEAVKAQSVHPELMQKFGAATPVVYTPLNGAGNVPMCRVLDELGMAGLHVVKEQEAPDPDFPTLPSPNPEDPRAFKLALELAKKTNAELVLASDPDADRLGVAVKDGNGEYMLLPGNAIGALLTEYILSQKKLAGVLPADGAVISTIVSTDITRHIAAEYGAAYIDVLTGFKYIGGKMNDFEQDNSHTFLFGFEESYGYLTGTYARDKDAIVAAMLMCDLACWCKSRGETVIDALNALYNKYGWYKESQQSLTMSGIDGQAAIASIMEGLRAHPPLSVDGRRVIAVRDYMTGVRRDALTGAEEQTGLPVSDVLYFELEGGAWFAARPSGTEPKIKIYHGVKGESAADALAGLASLSAAVMAVAGPKNYL